MQLSQEAHWQCSSCIQHHQGRQDQGRLECSPNVTWPGAIPRGLSHQQPACSDTQQSVPSHQSGDAWVPTANRPFDIPADLSLKHRSSNKVQTKDFACSTNNSLALCSHFDSESSPHAKTENRALEAMLLSKGWNRRVWQRRTHTKACGVNIVSWRTPKTGAILRSLKQAVEVSCLIEECKGDEQMAVEKHAASRLRLNANAVRRLSQSHLNFAACV